MIPMQSQSESPGPGLGAWYPTTRPTIFPELVLALCFLYLSPGEYRELIINREGVPKILAGVGGEKRKRKEGRKRGRAREGGRKSKRKKQNTEAIQSERAQPPWQFSSPSCGVSVPLRKAEVCGWSQAPGAWSAAAFSLGAQKYFLWPEFLQVTMSSLPGSSGLAVGCKQRGPPPPVASVNLAKPQLSPSSPLQVDRCPA